MDVKNKMNGFGSRIDGLPSSGTDDKKDLLSLVTLLRYIYVILCMYQVPRTQIKEEKNPWSHKIPYEICAHNYYLCHNYDQQ